MIDFMMIMVMMNELTLTSREVYYKTARTRAGFSWWGAWGPAIGIGDGGKGVALPHYTPEIPENIFRANIM